VPILLTGSTRELLGEGFVTRRLCQVRVVGIQGAVTLFELHGETASPEWLAFRDRYESALALYESRQWLQTCQALLPLLEPGQDARAYDHATLKLMKQSWAHLETPPDAFEPVLELPANESNRGSCCVRGGLTNILDYIRELYSSISPQGRSVSDG